MNEKYDVATRIRVARRTIGVFVLGLVLLGLGLNVAQANDITIQPGQPCPSGDYCSITFSDGTTSEIVGPCTSTSEATFSCIVLGNGGSGTGGSGGSISVGGVASPNQLLYNDAVSKIASLRGVQASSSLSPLAKVSDGQNAAYMYLHLLKIANSNAGNTAPDSQASCTYDFTSGKVSSCSAGTLDETLAAYYAGVINEDRKAVAQEAMTLYSQFIYDPCTFKAPAGDPNAVIDKNQAFCDSWGGVGSLFQGLELEVPSAEQFTSWAEGIVHKQALQEWASDLQDSNTSLTPDQALHQAAFEYEQAFSGASEGSAYLTAVHAALGQSQSLNSSTATAAETDVQDYWIEGLHDISADFNREVMLNKFFSNLFELLVEQPVLDEAEEELVGTLVETYETGIAPAIAAATGAAFVIWNTVKNNTVQPTLQNNLTDAEKDYTLAHYAADATGRALILDAVVKSTLPLYYSQVLSAAVAPSGGPDLQTDPMFQVTPEGQASSEVASFQSKDWTENVLGVSQIVSVRDGWFVSHASDDSTWRYQSHIDLINNNNERWRVWLAGKKFLAERFGVDAGAAQVYDGVNGCSLSSPLMTSGNMDIGYTCVIAMGGYFTKAVEIGDQVEIDGEVREVAGVDKDANGNVTSFITTKPFEEKSGCSDCAIGGPVWILAHPDGNCLKSNSLGSRATGPDCIWNSSLSIQDPNSPTKSLTVKLVYRPVLTVTAPTTAVDYGAGPPQIAPSYSGFVDGDTAASLTTPPTCTTNYRQWDAPGTYTTQCSGAVDSKYAIKYVNGTLTVNAKNITVTVTAPNLTTTYGEVPGGFAPTVEPNVPVGTFCSFPGYALGDSVGTYQTKCTVLSPQDYPNITFNYVPGTLTVKPAPLTVTASDGSMTYGGTPPAIVPSYTGFIFLDSAAKLTTQPTCSTAASSSSPVGTYASSCSGAVDPNYVITYKPGSVKVNPAPLTITASDGSMTYGGTPPTITPFYSGFVNGDNAGSLTTQPACFTDATSHSPVGTYGSSCSGAVDGNYVMTYKPGSVKVNPAPLTITASSATMVIGGTPPAITPLYAGFVNGESAANLTTAPTCSTTATSTSPVGSYSSTCSGAVDPNYAFTYKDGTVSVAYGQVVLNAHKTPKQSNSDTPIKVELLDANGRNLSSAAITLTLTPSPVAPDPAPGVQPTGSFRLTSGMYLFNLKTKHYPSGSYTLSFTATGDPTTHSVPFALK